MVSGRHLPLLDPPTVLAAHNWDRRLACAFTRAVVVRSPTMLRSSIEQIYKCLAIWKEARRSRSREQGESRMKNSAGPKMHSLELSYSIYA
jgi:hypothetical protein